MASSPPRIRNMRAETMEPLNRSEVKVEAKRPFVDMETQQRKRFRSAGSRTGFYIPPSGSGAGPNVPS